MAELVSDALGFQARQLPDFEKDLKTSGLTGVEFRRDPDVPVFYQAVFESARARDKYAKHRGMTDMQADSLGTRLTQADLDRAAELVSRMHP